VTGRNGQAEAAWSVHPSGWFAIAHAGELKKGAILIRRAFGRELVAFRSATGTPAVLDAHCPHMGAHLGHGGRVDGEAIRCPMHGFTFDARGSCLSTPYAAKVPPTARARAYPVSERNELLLVWHDALGRAPSWEVPEVDGAGFGPPLHHTLAFRGHPQETTENAVDLGHLGEVHGYREVEVQREPHSDGAHLTVRYGMTRASPFGAGRAIRAEFDIHVHGLGFSFVEVRVLGTGLHTQHFVSATPVDAERCEMRVAMRMARALEPSRLHAALGLLPPALARSLVARGAFHGFLGDIQQDVRIWEHKRYVDPPALAEGDGPVGRFRQWARQFYPALPEPAQRSPA
jgi:phenylpropionate dioxygenase-like ring-hydroxylating dioxygenase large terminal subunit